MLLIKTRIMKQSFKMGKNLFAVVIILCLSQIFLFASFSNAQTVKVGVILDLNSSAGRIGFTSLQLAHSDFYQNHPNYSTRIQLHVRDSSTGATGAAASALDLLKNVQVDAIIGPQKSGQAAFVIDLADAANVPAISFSATSPSFNAQSQYFVQTGVNDAAQVDAIAALVKNFGWSQVVLVYEDSDYGRGIIPFLSNAFQEVNARVSYRSVIPVSATDGLILRELNKTKNMETRVFVVHISKPLASKFFVRVKEAGMMSQGYAWIVTGGLMDLFNSLDSRVVESMQGVVGVRPLVPDSEKLQSYNVNWKKKFLQDYPGNSSEADQMKLFGLWAYDTLWALALAAERVEFRQQSWSGSNSTNMFVTQVSPTGPKLLQQVLRTEFQGLSGEFRLSNRQLEPHSFQILNVVGDELREVGTWTRTNTTSSSSKLVLLKGVAWPGGESAPPPKGWEFPIGGKKLRVGVPQRAGFPEFFNATTDPQTNAKNYSGLFKDLFEAVIKALPYVVEYEYIPFVTTNASILGIYYDELARQVSIGNFDVAVGDISITAIRSQFVDFSLPVVAGGVTRTQKINAYDEPYHGKWFFLKPFERNLWLSVIALFVLTGVALWILEHRFNEAFRGPPSEHIGLIFFVPFISVLLSNSERTVSNLGRVVTVTFLFVVLILKSTYTANLTATLTESKLEKMETDVSALIRKGEYVGCREGAFIASYLTTRLGFKETMIKKYNSSEEVDKALSKGGKGGIKAFFSCELYTDVFFTKFRNRYKKVGPTYLSEGYGFAFPKGSPMVADVSRAIVELMDNRTIENIQKHRIGNLTDQNLYDKAWTSMRLQSFSGLFGITGGVTAACLAIFLASYLCNYGDSIREIYNSGDTAPSKIRSMCKHFDQRDTSMARSIGSSVRRSAVFPVSDDNSDTGTHSASPV